MLAVGPYTMSRTYGSASSSSTVVNSAAPSRIRKIPRMVAHTSASASQSTSSFAPFRVEPRSFACLGPSGGGVVVWRDGRALKQDRPSGAAGLGEHH